MESRESVQVRVGLFVFAGVFLAMIIIFLLGGEKQLFTRQYTLHASFEDISGLRVGAPVLLAGVRVGMVDRIGFSKEPSEKKVQVRLSLNREFQERIRRDSIASINTQGLLGDKIVSIGVGSPDQEILKDGEGIVTEERPGLFSIVEKGSETMESITQAARQLREILQRINRGEGTLGALAVDPGLYQDLRRLLGKMERNKLLRQIIRSRIRDLDLEKTENSPPR